MFFILSKILAFLLHPLLWVFALMVPAIFLKNNKKRWYFLVSATALLFIFGNITLVDRLMTNWEYPVIHTDSVGHYNYGIVLSGMGAYHEESNSFHFYSEADRLIQALTLYKQNKIDTIILSGGSGRLVNKEHKESEYLKSYLLRWGIPERDILMESDSRNTHENAKNTTNRFYEPGNSYLLITSGFHMRRALACFHKQGMNPDVFPTGPARERTTKEIVYFVLPHIEAFRQWNLLLKEWVGYVVYDLVGYI